MNNVKPNYSSIWLYNNVKTKNLKATEELFYSFLIKKTIYEMKDYCSDSVFDKDGNIDWSLINDEFVDIPIVVSWVYQTDKIQQYIEDKLGISRMTFFRIMKSLKEKGLICTCDAMGLYRDCGVIELFKDDYRDKYDVDKDKYHGKCYILNIDYMDFYMDEYRYIYLNEDLLKTPKLLYFYSWMLDRFTYWDNKGKKFMTSAEHLAEEYGVSLDVFKKMVVELKRLGYISKEYKKEWYVYR